jgi:UDP-2-acetamido-2,6-beta-L-arabino-hexul-4-ose reductase
VKVAVTGAGGFLGWHLRVRLKAEHGVEAVPISRTDFASVETLAERLSDVETVYHLAGVNRAESDEAVETGNAEIARSLAEAIRTKGQPIHVVYGNSIQAALDNAYGRGKRQAAQMLAETAEETGGTLADVMLPNIFGEHGRPHYNSFVATFCHVLARGCRPSVTGERLVPLLHAQEAASALIEAGRRREEYSHMPKGSSHTVNDILGLLEEYRAVYGRGEIPELPSAFHVDLFNTYRSFLFPGIYPMKTAVNADQRGDLFETVRSHSRAGQTFVSTTCPGMTRGEHFHLRKIERFFVLQGEAEICLRRVLDDEVVRFRLRGQDHAFIDMPTMWVHNIKNVGDEPLMTLFWTDELYDPASPDTYREPVEAGVA